MKPVTKSGTAAAGDVPRLTEHLFRRESGRLVSVLTGIFGPSHMQLAEDVVQEAMIKALQTWPYYGVPQNPTGWIMQTARNLALDVLRREKRFQEKQASISDSLERWSSTGTAVDKPALEQEITDDQLRLMFVCCHPLLVPEAQTALALKTLCGFHPKEIASAFLTTEAAILKRLTRAKQRIAEQHIPFAIPTGDELAERLGSVLQILYLLFNEGYKASSGQNLVREELCSEAIRLTTLLAQHPSTSLPRTHALLALMLLHGARLGARENADGQFLRLENQDRSTWDGRMIQQGIRHLAQSAQGDEVSEYHLQAGIAACHATAPDYKSTDWERILALYDQWLEMNDSPVVALNRAVAVAMVHGPAEGLRELETLPNPDRLNQYYLIYAVKAEFEAQLRNDDAAAGHLRKAHELAGVKSEQEFLSRRLQELG